MAYLVGLLCADGAVVDARKSSRTCYVALTNKDLNLLYQVRRILSSNHRIYKRPEQIVHFRGSDKSYISSGNYYLRIGNKIIFQDLVNLGVKPRKSLCLRLPKMPTRYFAFFLRGYFDGDGCIYLENPTGINSPRLRTIFTSGSQKLLSKISEKLYLCVGSSKQKIYRQGRAYRLFYNKRDSLKILKLMYRHLESAPFLRRKYKKYLQALTFI